MPKRSAPLPETSEPSPLASNLPGALAQQCLSPEDCAAAFRAHTPHARGRPAKLTPWQFILSMIAQALAGSGALPIHVLRMTKITLSSAALALR